MESEVEVDPSLLPEALSSPSLGQQVDPESEELGLCPAEL